MTPSTVRGGTVPTREALGALLLGASAVFAAAALDGSVPSGIVAGLIGAALALGLPLPWAAALPLIGAHILPWLTGRAVGPLAVVDVMMLVLILRTAPRLIPLVAKPSQPRVPLLLVGGFLGLALVPSVLAAGDASITAFLRIATYLGYAFAVMLTLESRGRTVVLLAFVGACVGDVGAAFASLSPTIPTSFPLGRYVGTLGDPAQFGVSIAVALVLIVGAPELLRHRPARAVLSAILVAGLVGSATRSAGGAFVVGFLTLTALALAERDASPQLRAALGALAGAGLVIGVVTATVGAGAIGLDASSTSVRIQSVSASWSYLTTFPFSPTGMGNIPGEFPAYNTWLAAAVALGIPAAAVLVALALRAMLPLRGAERDGQPLARGVLAALVGLALVSFTENLVFAGSSLTITWFVLLAMAVAIAGDPPEAGPKDASDGT